ncbi:MAG: serine/threonine protein kinase [Acidobacteria bacterium]|nr:serine/threonine protein kinase [Acidobacteriota bacterium]
MTHERKRIAPRPPTPSTRARDTGPPTGRLPDDLLAEQVRRFELFTGVGAGLWTLGLAMDGLILPAVAGRIVSGSVIAVEAGVVLISFGLFLYVRYAGGTPQSKTDFSLWYMLANAAAVALLNTVIRVPTTEHMGHLSWITIVILVSSMIMPSTPRKTLVASLAAASLDPLGIWIADLRGLPVPSVAGTLAFYMPNYACAIVATLPPLYLQRLTRRLREAEDLGSYRLMERLGQGGMGEVWRAHHRLLASDAAIKLVRPEVLGVGDSDDAKLLLRRFEREARATAALSSPHTIQIFDFGATDDGTFYYVMELLTGRDLESLVRDFGPLPANRVLYLLRQACHSLADAHARGLVHRDIKPANVYVCRMGLDYDFVKVLDFGLVKLQGPQTAGQSLLTMDHRASGTPAYMAPEIILGEADVDRRADVYALGCVAYYLLTGQLVFEAETPMKMLLQHVQARPVPPSQRTELPIPPELDDLVLSCLEKDPNKRPQNAEELLRFRWDCRTCERWTNELASAWWQAHMPDLTGPLTVAGVEEGGDADRRVVAFR